MLKEKLNVQIHPAWERQGRCPCSFPPLFHIPLTYGIIHCSFFLMAHEGNKTLQFYLQYENISIRFVLFSNVCLHIYDTHFLHEGFEKKYHSCRTTFSCTLKLTFFVLLIQFMIFKFFMHTQWVYTFLGSMKCFGTGMQCEISTSWRMGCSSPEASIL